VIIGDVVFTATVGIGHGKFGAAAAGIELCSFDDAGRGWFCTAGEAAGVEPGWLALCAGEDVEGKAMVPEVLEDDVDGWREAMAGASFVPSFSRRRFTPLVELSFKPRAVALMRIWCRVRLMPHCDITHSHSISPDVFLDLLSSATFFRRSVSSSDQAPWLPMTVPPVAGVVVIVAVG